MADLADIGMRMSMKESQRMIKHSFKTPALLVELFKSGIYPLPGMDETRLVSAGPIAFEAVSWQLFWLIKEAKHLTISDVEAFVRARNELVDLPNLPMWVARAGL